MKYKIRASVFAISLIMLNQGYAQTIVSPKSVNPANITWDLEGQFDSLTPASTPKISIMPSSTKPKLAPKKAGPKFVLKGIHLIHSGPVPPEVIEIYQASLNKSVDLMQLKEIAGQMQSVYRDRGDILVRVVVPQQEIDKNNAIVNIEVIEGQVQKVKFTGNVPKSAQAQLQRYANAIQNEDPITYQTIDHYLTLANSLPGVDVTATVVPSETTVGGADLDISVKAKRSLSFIGFNNFGNQYIGPGEILGGATIYNLFAADSITFTGATSASNTHQLAYISGSYDAIVGPYSTEINPVISDTTSHPGGSLAPLEMTGISKKYTLNVNQPLMVNSKQKLTFISSIYRLSSTNTAFSNQQLYNDEITALTAGLEFSGLLLNSLNKLDAYTTIGLPILGAPSSLNNPSRINGKTKFIIFDFDTSTIHYFTQKLSFDLETTGQLSPNPLLTSEQIGFGGMQYGKGFNAFAISGDNGLQGTFALRYDLPAYGNITSIQPEVFYSAGLVSSNQSLASTYNQAEASSAGLGLNLGLFHSIQLTMSVAKPLHVTQVNYSKNGWQAYINAIALF